MVWFLLLFEVRLLAAVEVVLCIAGEGARPYVVVWVEKETGEYVRTLRMWGGRPKYQSALREWRRGGGKVEGMSGATRPNGEYRVIWDGLDAEGKELTPGVYRLRAECVREEGARSTSGLTIDTSAPPGLREEGPKDRDIHSFHATLVPPHTTRP